VKTLRTRSPTSVTLFRKSLNAIVCAFDCVMLVLYYTICRSTECQRPPLRSATVVIPARNEKGNIEPAVRRLPRFVEDLEDYFC
jgi:hypothetical protein